MTHIRFVRSYIGPLDEVVAWLNSLLNLSGPIPSGDRPLRGQITKIIDWQVVPTGRPYEYTAIVQVEVEERKP